MIFDPMYFIILAPALLLAVWAQFRVKSAYGHASRIGSRSRVSGAEAAELILQRSGVPGVRVEMVPGQLSDHYDPKHKVLRLSPDVYHGRSLASLGIAAHEAGHAIQDKVNYGPLRLRNGIVPLAAVGSNLSTFLFIIGLVMSGAGAALGPVLMWGGIGLFSTVVVFQLINLPVEFDASARAKAVLQDTGLVAGDEAPEVKRVLSAAALTYVAATLTAILTLAYFLLRAQGSRE